MTQIQHNQPRAAGNVQAGDRRGNVDGGQAGKAGGVQRGNGIRQRQPGQIREVVAIPDLDCRKAGAGGQIQQIQILATGNIQRGESGAGDVQGRYAARNSQLSQIGTVGDVQRSQARAGGNIQTCQASAGDIQGC